MFPSKYQGSFRGWLSYFGSKHGLIIVITFLCCMASLGECQATNSDSVSWSDCEFYSRIGECHRRPNWMMQNCAQACVCPVRAGVVLTPRAGSLDVSPANDGGVVKDIIRAGAVNEYPPPGAVLYTHYYGRLTNGSRFDASRFRGHMFVFSIGTWFVIAGWEYAVPTMKRGEVADLFIQPQYAYGDQGFHDVIPPGATLVIEVQLFDWRDTCTNYNRNETQCEIYRDNGGCEENEWTQLNCKRTCNLCDLPDWCVNLHPSDEDCDVFARKGECDYNPNWMLVNCARACAHCPETELAECRDLHPVKANCEYWRSIGECTDEDSERYVANACRLTCGFCTPDTSAETDLCENIHDDSSECGYWASIGECTHENSMEWMEEHCARSCNTCPTGCFNLNEQCDIWASAGHCTGNNRDWMAINCRQSCQKCIKIPAGAIDVTPDGSGAVYKRVIREGYGTATPPRGSVIYSHYTGPLVGSSRSEDTLRMWIYVNGVSPAQVIDGWRFAVPTMRRGEVAELVIQPEHAYGSGGTGNIAPDSVLVIRVELFDWREACSDVNQNCATWAADGECEANPNFMNLNCRLSCNTCQQPESCVNIDDTNCDIWANSGECDLNMVWMRENCPRSCNMCDPKPDECLNSHPHIENCQFWRSEGECTSDPSSAWVSTHCEHTCNQCAPDDCDNIHEPGEECDNWAMTGECSDNAEWMQDNCAKSCDLCNTKPGSREGQFILKTNPNMELE